MSWAVEFVEVHRPPLLRGVSFGATSLGITAIVGGPEGARAQLFRMVVGLDAPRFGAVLVLGRDMSRASARDHRRLQRRLAVVFAGPEHGLFGAASARENIAAAVRAAGRVGRRGERATIDDALRSLDLTPVAHLLPGELSPVQRKRLALARGLALNSPLLVVDAFDEESDAREVAAIAKAIRVDRTRRGGAALLVMADGELAERVADHVVPLLDA